MYKVLLVDDEVLTRNAISQNVPWEETGFQLVGTAENGQEALRMVEETKPDLVLTDICMPVMDGLALSAHLHENYPNIKVVIISGYDDFEYAKQAIKYEVSNYIIKPITSYELIEELKKTKEKIEHSLERKKELEKAKKEFEEYIPTLQSHFLNQLLEGNYSKRYINKKMNQLNIHVVGRLQAIVMLDVEEFQKIDMEEQLIDFSVANIVGEVVAEYPNIIFLKNVNNKSLLIFSENSEEELAELIKKICEHITAVVYKCMNAKIYVLVGKTVAGATMWEDSYQNAIAAREYKFLFEDQQFIYGKEVVVEKNTRQVQFIRQIDNLILAIKLNHMVELKKEVANLFQNIRNSGKEKKQMLVIIQNLALSIFISLEVYVADKMKAYDKDEFILQLSELKHLNEVEKRFLQCCEELAILIAGKRESENQKQAIRAMDYIEKNYMNIEISLNVICEYLCVSTSYFSVIFKNTTGMTFIEFLTRVRIKKAKELLESTNMKSYEIALAVGYQDPHYFSSIFKKHVSVTPMEYAKQLKKGE